MNLMDHATISAPVATTTISAPTAITQHLATTFTMSSSSLAPDVSTAQVQVDVLSTQDIVVGTILAFALALSYSYLNGQSTSSSFVSWGSQIPSKQSIRDNDADELLNEGNESLLSNDGAATSSGAKMNKIFNKDDWQDMSREENYILYNTRIRNKISGSSSLNDSKMNIESNNGIDVDSKSEYGKVNTNANSDNNSKNYENGMENKSDRLQQEKANKENKLVLLALMAIFLPIFSIEIFFALSRQFMCEMGGGNSYHNWELAQRMCSPIGLVR